MLLVVQIFSSIPSNNDYVQVATCLTHMGPCMTAQKQKVNVQHSRVPHVAIPGICTSPKQTQIWEFTKLQHKHANSLLYIRARCITVHDAAAEIL